MGTLESWARQMWESAELDVAFTRSASSHGFGGDASDISNPNAFRVGSTLSSRWHAWILAESVHRSYTLAMFVQSVFLVLKTGWTPCSGAVPLTFQRGLWDSMSAYSWARAYKDSTAGVFVRTGDDRLLVNARPDDVDDFAVATLVLLHGLERVEQWVGDSGRQFARALTESGRAARDAPEIRQL
jgi:hypothetical protein